MASKLLNDRKENEIHSVVKRINKKRLLLLLLVIFVVYLVFSNYRSRNTVVVSTDTAKTQDISETINVSGRISAEKRADLNFLTSGEISSIDVQLGDEVKQGQILARINTTILYQAYLQAQDSLRSANATLERVYDDIQGHDDDESFAQREKRTSAETAKNVAYRSLVQAGQNLSNATLRSPFSGIVAYIADGLAPGVFVAPGTPQVVIVDPETIIFEADVNETNIPKIYPGQKVNVKLDAYPEVNISGEVTRIGVTSVTTSTGGTAYKVQIRIPGDIGDKFKLGMNGDAEFIIDEKSSVLSIPVSALIEESVEEKYVWISDSGSAKKVQVETGISSFNDIQIIKGLEEGQTVIVRPPNNIKDGNKIIDQSD